ncbi:MAG: adenosylcobinamide-phosphate synthase CbiB [bacterium]
MGYEVILGYGLDLIFGDPIKLPHPIKGIGRFIKFLEKIVRKSFFNLKIGGFFLAGIVILGTYVATSLIVWLSEQIHSQLEFIVSGVIIFTTISIRSLHKEAIAVYHALIADDIDLARIQLAKIVGRDTHNLDKTEISRGAVETVAENTVDGIISPLFYAFLGGPALAMAFKAVSTLDSMLGYKSKIYKEIGWASARIDDIANFIPARISAYIIPIASWLCGKKGISALKVIIRDGHKNPSPNSGIPEAGFAGALNIQLGGLNYYQGEMFLKPFLGDANETVEPKHILQSIQLMYLISFLMLIIGFLVLLGIKLI